MPAQRIDTIKKKFHNEWLLIEVDKTDETTTTSISGKLLAHSPLRDEIYKKLIQIKSNHPLLVDYSEQKLPEGVAVVFRIYV